MSSSRPFRPSIVPPATLSPVEAVRLRVKKMFRLDGMYQCPRCGCRSMVTETTGAVVKDGKKHGGTVTAKDVCAACFKRGINSPMAPEIKGVGT